MSSPLENRILLAVRAGAITWVQYAARQTEETPRLAIRWAVEEGSRPATDNERRAVRHLLDQGVIAYGAPTKRDDLRTFGVFRLPQQDHIFHDPTLETFSPSSNLTA